MTVSGNIQRAIFFIHSVRHTRPHQLAERARLLAKRKLLEQWARLFGSHPAVVAEPMQRRGELPPPLFPPRLHLVRESDARLCVCFLNESRPLTVPMQWHPADLGTGTLGKITLHYMEYLEALDDAWFARVVSDWIDQNPPYRASYWLDNWNSYALSIRCVVWMQQLQPRRVRLDPAVVRRIEASLVAQLRFLRRNLEQDIGGNHLIKNIKTLLWAGSYFTGREADAWAALGERLLARELQEQVLPDGFHYERSAAYHAQVFADLLECYAVLRTGERREQLAGVLDRMAQALADTTHPDGRVSLFNDAGLHMAYAPDTCLEVYARLRGRRVEPRGVFAFPDAGYYGLREGEDYLIVDCGALAPDFLPAHGHGDALSFEWSVEGERMIVDAGVFEYLPGAWRAYSRSTRAHNTVEIADRDQSEFWGSFRVARRARCQVHQYRRTADGFVLVGSHDGYTRLAGSPVHRRRFVVGPRRLEVEDEVSGGAGQSVVARLLLHPDCAVKLTGTGARISRGSTVVELVTEQPVEVARAWWMPDFGVRMPTDQLVIPYPPAPSRSGFGLRVHSPALAGRQESYIA